MLKCGKLFSTDTIFSSLQAPELR